ncbi:MAG: 30S ribosomal protein S15, partial [Candidatus Norongarragalinales archaeon]
MARLHSRKRGKSGSKKPSAKQAPGWIPLSKEEVTALV